MDALSQALLGAHSIWRYVVLISIFVAIGNAFIGWLDKRDWKPSDTRIGRFYLSVIDLEVILGILVWFQQGRWDAVDMLRSRRHPALMLLALAVVHYGWWRAHHMPTARARFGLLTMYFLISGIVIFVGVLQIQGAI